MKPGGVEYLCLCEKFTFRSVDQVEPVMSRTAVVPLQKLPSLHQNVFSLHKTGSTRHRPLLQSSFICAIFRHCAAETRMYLNVDVRFVCSDDKQKKGMCFDRNNRRWTLC